MTQKIAKEIAVAARVTSTTTPAQLSSLDYAHSAVEILFQAHPNNTDNIELGDAAAQVIVLEPGDTLTILLSDPGMMWHKSVTGSQTLNYIGRR